MMIGKILTNKFLLTLFIIGVFMTSPIATASGFAGHSDGNTNAIPTTLTQDQLSNLAPDTVVPPTSDVGNLLGDNNNTFGEVWDPWLTRAAIHAVATYEDWLALASGYLYDNQIHLYRWNEEIDQYTLVWEVGGGDFVSDVFTLDFADTNHNNLIEIIAGGEDGRFYVFEQKHIYDPQTNTENMFELVYKSERLGRIFDLVVSDTDGDYKQDIIVGTLEHVRFFEYSDHSGYPFNEEHWIEYEESFSIDVTSYFENYTEVDNLYAVTALEVADTNSNGLWEVVIGTRAGTVFLLENNGTVIDINGSPFPYMRDDNYKLIWDSGASIQRSITDMEAGDIDRDGYNEILMVVQGIGAYVLDNIEGEFGTYRIQRDYAGWESDPKGAYPLDTTIDWMLNSSSLESVDGSIAEFNPANFSYYGDYNVYLEYSGSNATTHGNWPEPLTNAASSGMPEVFPYRTAMAQPTDDIFTTFNAGIRDAWAILDWGFHEEAAGNGIGTLWDFEMNIGGPTENPDFNHDFTFSISQDNTTWYEIPANDVVLNNINNPTSDDDDTYRVEVDNVLNELGWTQYRYLKLNVTSGLLRVDSFETRYFNKPLYDAQSAAMGEITLKGDTTASTVGFVGTVDGALLAVYWNETSGDYEIVWDSWVDERYKLSKNIFDLESVSKTSTFPAWLDLESQSYTMDFSSGMSQDGTDFFSYDIDNFYNYRDEQALEMIVTSTGGNIYAYNQASPDAVPSYDPTLTNYLFNTDLLGIQNNFGIPGSPQAWMDAQSTDYFSAQIVSMDTQLPSEDEDSPYQNFASGYWLFLSKWDGQHNATSRDIGDVETSIWYLFNFPNAGPLAEVCDPLPRCAAFIPVFNNITESLAFIPKTVTNSEVTGQMNGVFGTSTWVPKINAYDALGSEDKDLIVTNGKIYLLETTHSQSPTPGYGPADTMFGDLTTQIRPDYFQEINEDSKGRIWTNPEPVDFDGDGDMDMILGFARYDDGHFGVDKVSYGFTYWENQGTAAKPIWVEQKKAVTNNDAESNFRVDKWADPVMVFDDYEFGEQVFDPVNGYHPLYRTSKATRLFLFQPSTDANLFRGTIKQFVADYTHPTSLLLATYPEAKRVDINLDYKISYPSAINYGFHVFETWDNSDELRGWTLSMDTADLDQDGKHEVIVGDFNNNAYVFEHLTNNTFKRAYKSHDINRTILTDESPYAYEQFDGISGEFYRTIFDHVEYLVAGVDTNQNGLLEFVAATSDMVFIFENVLTPGGFYQQDTFQLIGTIDMFAQSAIQSLTQEEITITSIAVASDSTHDGRNEIIIGVDSSLLIFEIGVNEDPYDESTKFLYEEVFYRNTGLLLGLYNLPGNHFLYPDLQINTILTEDINQDGYLDIMIAGRDETNAVQIQDGFLFILYYDGAEFRYLFETSTFEDTIRFNPINDLKVDDHDYDTYRELYIAHESGIDVYEFYPDNTVEFQELITSNPHYQLPQRAYNRVPVLSHPDTGGNVLPIEVFEHDTVRLSNGNLGLAAIASYDINGVGSITYHVVYTVSTDEGVTWNTAEEIASSSSYIYRNVDVYFNQINNPVIAYTTLSTIILSMNTIYVSSIQVATRLGAESYDIKNPVAISAIDVGYPNVYPKLYDIPEYNQNGDVGLAYLENVPGQPSNITFGRYSYSVPGGFQEPVVHPYVNGTEIDYHIRVQNWDITQLDFDEPNHSDRRNYGIVLSGYIYNESLSFDTDLFFGEMYFNETSAYNFTRPTRTQFSGYSVARPSIIQETHTGNLMITFEQESLRPYGGLWSTWSDDGGLSWQGPYDMSHPLGLDPEGINVPMIPKIFNSPSKETYRIGAPFAQSYITRFDPTLPIIAPGGNERGYTMVYEIDIEVTVYIQSQRGGGFCRGEGADFQNSVKAQTNYCNPSAIVVGASYLVSAFQDFSNFTWYKVDGVDKIVTGDTDKDGRREIFAASGDHAVLFELQNNTETMILHNQEWTSQEYFYGVSDVAMADINGNGFEELIISSERGTVNAFSILDTNVTISDYTLPNLAPQNEGVGSTPIDPFIFLGNDFTFRTDYIVYDITGDDIEDIMVIDDYFVGISDTEKLRNDPLYNDVIWAHDLPEFGRYLQEYLIIDSNGDGRDEIVIAFEKAITAITIADGTFLWNHTLLADTDYFGRNWNVKLEAWNIGINNYVVVAQDFYDLTNGWTSALYAITSTGSNGSVYQYIGFFSITLNTGPFYGADATNEILLTMRNATNPLQSRFVVLNDGGVTDSDISIIYPPVTHVELGNFDDSSPEDEIFITFDIAALGNFFGINWQIFPSIYMTLAYNGVFTLPAGIPFIGLSPHQGITRETHVVDYDANGQDDIIAQNKFGSLVSISTEGAGAINTIGGTFSNFGVPYAKHNVIFGDFCGVNSFVMTTSGSTVACYSSLDFSTSQTAVWSSDPINIDVIKEVVAGDFNEDSLTDVMIVGYFGFVWILDNPNLGFSNLDVEPLSDTSFFNDMPMEVYISFFTILGMMTTFGYYKKSEILAFLVKIRN